MSVNTGYYGDNWVHLNLVSVSAQDLTWNEFDIQRPVLTTQTPNSGFDTVASYYGNLALGDNFKQPIDASIAYCAMDANAPQLHIRYQNGDQTAGNHPNQIDIDYAPTSSTPVGMLGDPLNQPSGSAYWYGTNATSVPNYNLPWNIQDGVGTPVPSTYGGVSLGSSVSGYTRFPIVQFPFSNCLIFPVIVCAQYRTGKTKADLDALDDQTYYNVVGTQILQNVTRTDLATYLDENSNHNYKTHPVVLSVQAGMKFIQFEDDDKTKPITKELIATRQNSYCGFHPTPLRKMVKFMAHDPYTAGSQDRTFNFDMVLADDFQFNAGTIYISNAATGAATTGSYTTIFLWNIEGGSRIDGYVTSVPYQYNYAISPIWRGSNKWNVRKLSTRSSAPFVYTGAYQAVYMQVGTDTGSDISPDDFREMVRKDLAYYGCYFSDYAINIGATLNDDTMMLGIIDGSGITHGEYSQGTENAKQRQADWDSPLDDTPYDPNKDDGGGSDENPEDGGYGWQHGALNLPSTFAYINVQLASYNEVLALTNWMSMSSRGWDDLNDVTVDDLRLHLYSMQANFQNTYPEECLKMIRLMPFDMPTKLTVTSLTPTPFTLGSTRTAAYDNYSGTQIPGATCLHAASASAVFEWSSADFEVPTWYGDFRDYEPYTRLELQVPFCGTVNLDAAEFMGHVLRVEMQMDCIWGAVTAVILRDGQAYATLNGKIGVEVPFEVDAIGAFINTQMSNSFSAANAKLALNSATASTIQSGAKFIGKAVQAAVAIDAGAPISAAGDAANAGFDLYRQEQNRETAHNNYEAAQATLEHTAMGRSMMGQGESATQFSQDYHIVLAIHRPRLMDYSPAVYGRTVGFACDKTGRVGSFSGYTEFANVILDEITATDDMKALILQRLQSGVII